jgi:hypothetical protein
MKTAYVFFGNLKTGNAEMADILAKRLNWPIFDIDEELVAAKLKEAQNDQEKEFFITKIYEKITQQADDALKTHEGVIISGHFAKEKQRHFFISHVDARTHFIWVKHLGANTQDPRKTLENTDFEKPDPRLYTVVENHFNVQANEDEIEKLLRSGKLGYGQAGQ